MWLRFDWVTRYILTSFKNGIVKEKLETYKSLVDQRWSLDISNMRTFVFYSNTSPYSHMLLFYFLLPGVSPNPYAQPKSIIWSIKNQCKCSKWQNKKLQRTDATGQRNKLLNTKTVLVQASYHQHVTCSILASFSFLKILVLLADWTEPT